MKRQEISGGIDFSESRSKYRRPPQQGWREHLKRKPDYESHILPSITEIITSYQHSPASYYFESFVMSGFLSVGVSFLYQPADNVKTKVQAYPNLNSLDALKYIYNRDGVAGFWTGMKATGIRSLCRESYRIPAKIHTPQLVSDYIFSGPSKNHQLINIVSSFIMAFVDASLTCPFDSLKVKQMTSPIKLSFMAAYNKGGFYNGFNALVLKSFVSSLGFLTMDDLVKQQLKKHYATERLSNGSILSGALVTAFMLNMIDTPFDVIKTNLQKDGIRAATGIINTVKHIYNNNGIQGFYKGSCLRLYGGALSVAAASLLREVYSKNNSQQSGINR